MQAMTAHSPINALARVRVLVVDDDKDGADTLASLLQLEGYDVRTENDGLHALPTIQQWQPRCVLLDIDLPGLDGFDIARRLRRDDREHRMILIATTGWARGGRPRNRRRLRHRPLSGQATRSRGAAGGDAAWLTVRTNTDHASAGAVTVFASSGETYQDPHEVDR